jgi:Lon-like ATP-dependent protease
VGATTRQPSEIPSAVRSRCIEIFFQELTPSEVRSIAGHAAKRIGAGVAPEALNLIETYATNGREAVNMIQLAAGVAGDELNFVTEETTIRCIEEGNEESINTEEHKKKPESGFITTEILEWVVSTGCYVPRPHKKIPAQPQIGVANGLAVYGTNTGLMFELEVTGVAEEEEQGDTNRKIRRKSMVCSSIENVLTVLRRNLGVEPRNYDLHVNIPGGVPLDGPSAGITIATAVYSAILGCDTKAKTAPSNAANPANPTNTTNPANPANPANPTSATNPTSANIATNATIASDPRTPVCGLIDNTVAMTGEISIRGMVHAVGGVTAKLVAARQSGCHRVLIPRDNWQERYKQMEGLEVIPVETLEEVLSNVLLPMTLQNDTDALKGKPATVWQHLTSTASGHLPEQGQHGKI